MTLGPTELALYAGALLILFLTPGPVWVALVARAISGGFRAAWPLALGVVVGDVLWPLLAIFGLNFIVSVYAGFLDLLRYAGAIIFLVMGILLIRHAGGKLSSDARLTRPGMWAGFIAGLLVILGNPKAILFYMGVLPGFFDIANVTGWDIAAICLLSAIIPLLGNLILAAMVGRVKRFLNSPVAIERTHIISGTALIGVGVAIAIL